MALVEAQGGRGYRGYRGYRKYRRCPRFSDAAHGLAANHIHELA